VDSTPDEELLNALSPIIDKIVAKTPVTHEQQLVLVDLFKNIGIGFLPVNTDKIDELLADENVQAVVNQLKDQFGDDVDVNVEELAGFGLTLNTAIYKEIKRLSADDLIDLATDSDARDALVADVYNAVYDDISEDDKTLAKAFLDTYFDGSKEDLKAASIDVYNNLKPLFGAELKTALPYLLSAYKAANASGGAGGGAVDSGNSGSVSDLLANLASLKEKLANATDAEKKDLIAQALKEANDVLAKVFTIDASGIVTKTDSSASVTIPISLVSEPIQNLKDIEAALVDAIGSADGLVIPTATFVVGNVDQTDVTNIAPEDVLSLLSGAEVNKVAFTTNGLTVTLPDTGDFAKGIEFSFKTVAATSEQTGGRAAASDVYTFSLKLGGTEVEKFSQPITIKFPVKGDGIDSELLTVARIESDGSLTILGGEDDTNAISLLRQKLSSYVVVENKVTFKDIGSVQAWAGRQIEVVAAKGAIQGKAAGVFAPKDSITRAEFAKILVSALGLADAEVPASKFTDVNANAWYAPYVAIAADKGIINGRSATTFDPNATITRAELSTMIARALKTFKGVQDVSDVDAALAAFSDAGKISSTLKAGVALAASKNIVIGDAGKFRPNDTASRAEAAVIVYRTLKVKA